MLVRPNDVRTNTSTCMVCCISDHMIVDEFNRLLMDTPMLILHGHYNQSRRHNAGKTYTNTYIYLYIFFLLVECNELDRK